MYFTPLNLASVSQKTNEICFYFLFQVLTSPYRQNNLSIQRSGEFIWITIHFTGTKYKI